MTSLKKIVNLKNAYILYQIFLATYRQELECYYIKERKAKGNVSTIVFNLPVFNFYLFTFCVVEVIAHFFQGGLGPQAVKACMWEETSVNMKGNLQTPHRKTPKSNQWIEPRTFLL